MNITTFLIQGSLKSPYKVTFQKNDDHIYAGCDCQSRKSGLVCKHILNILSGDATEMVKGDKNDIQYVLDLCDGTKFYELFLDYSKNFTKYNSKALTELKKQRL